MEYSFDLAEVGACLWPCFSLSFFKQKDKTQYLGIRYTELIPVLIKAIQEQQIQIDKLKNA